MGLYRILRQVNRELGFTQDQREIALDLINEAAELIWETTDLPGSLKEITVPISVNALVALPSYVGSVRKMRSQNDEVRYGGQNSQSKYQRDVGWKNFGWRDMGFSPIMTTYLDEGQLILTQQVHDDIVVTITGSKDGAALANESVKMDADSKETTTIFTEISSITKTSRSTYDITISTVGGTTLAVLENDAEETQYRLMDVSQFPDSGDCATDTTKMVMEVLYKPRLKPFSLDSDEFPVPGYDFIIAKKVLQIYFQNQPGQEQRTLAIDELVSRDLRRKMSDIERGINSVVRPTESGHDVIRRRMKWWPFLPFYRS